MCAKYAGEADKDEDGLEEGHDNIRVQITWK